MKPEANVLNERWKTNGSKRQKIAHGFPDITGVWAKARRSGGDARTTCQQHCVRTNAGRRKDRYCRSWQSGSDRARLRQGGPDITGAWGKVRRGGTTCVQRTERRYVRTVLVVGKRRIPVVTSTSIE